MKLRVTTESDTHAYATSPLNFGGFSKEDMLILILPMAAMHHITGEPLHEVGLGIGVLWVYKKLTMDQPEGHLAILISTAMGKLEHSEKIKKIKVLYSLVKFLNRQLSQVWISKGLLPSPTLCNVYES